MLLQALLTVITLGILIYALLEIKKLRKDN